MDTLTEFFIYAVRVLQDRSRAQTRPGLGAALVGWFGVDSDWERMPDDPARAYRHDLWLGVVFVVVSLVGAELGRSFGYFADETAPAWVLFLLAGSGAVPLIWRRRYPLVTLALAYSHFLVVGMTVPTVTMLAPLQVAYFVALFSAVAWSRDRRAMLLVVGAAVLAMFVWLAWGFAVGNGINEMVSRLEEGGEQPGTIPPAIAIFTYNWLLNMAYFFGAIAAGQLTWQAARHRDQLSEQAATIAHQADDLKRQAVVTERLHIARELHDVVAHHISVIGIHAAAARRMLSSDPQAAASPLATIENESREAVTQMRGLLGTLRDVESHQGDSAAARAPEPGLADIASLANSDAGLTVDVRTVEEPAGAAATVPGPLGLSLYRTTQEALSNVRKHSTARHASVVVRVDRRADNDRFSHGFVEVEVLDDGRTRTGSTGTGMGLLGIRERVRTHGGIADVGPRITGGYRVRVRLPLPEGQR